MTDLLPTPGQPWTDRAGLLAARAEAVPVLERRVLAMRRSLGEAGLVAVTAFTLPVAGEAFASGGPVGVGIGVVFALVGITAVVLTARSGLARHRYVRDLLAWDVRERAARDLPAGPLLPEHRTPWDARHDQDFMRVAGVLGGAAYVRPWRNGLLLRAVLAGAGLVVGLVLVLLGLMSPDEPVVFAVCAVLAGVWTFLCSAVTAVTGTRLSFRWTRLSAATDRDVRQIRAERAGQPAAGAREQ